MSDIPLTAERPLGFFTPAEAERPSLPEVNASIAVPQAGRWFMKLFAFMGPGYMVSVGYMDPGNWATDIRPAPASAAGASPECRGMIQRADSRPSSSQSSSCCSFLRL